MSRFVCRLVSGARLVCQANVSSIVHLGIMVGVGSRDEVFPGKGMAHLLEHVLFKGTERLSFDAILREVEGVGGEFNAYTSREETCLYVSIHKDFVERAFLVLSDIFYNSIIPADELEKEKQVVIDEINFYNDSLSELVVDDFEEKVYDANSLSNRILGTEEGVSSVSRTELFDFYENMYSTDSLVISYVGSVAVEEIERLSNVYFVDKRLKNDAFSHRKLVDSFCFFDEKIKKKSSQSHCVIGCKSLPVNHQDRFKMMLFNNIFGGSNFNSVLNMSLREKEGLTYNVESTYVPYSDTGVFYVYFGTDKSKVSKCIDIILGQLFVMQYKGLSFEQFQMSKQQVYGQLALYADNYLNEMITNAKSLLFSNEVLAYDDVINAYSSISYEEFNSFLNKYLLVGKMSKLQYL